MSNLLHKVQIDRRHPKDRVHGVPFGGIFHVEQFVFYHPANFVHRIVHVVNEVGNEANKAHYSVWFLFETFILSKQHQYVKKVTHNTLLPIP